VAKGQANLGSPKEVGQQQNGKLIGKNSLHMKRRSEYPEAPNQWHLPNQQQFPNNKSSAAIAGGSDSTKGGIQNFNFSKVNQNWGGQGTKTGHSGLSQSQGHGSSSQNRNMQ
jgi:hypothetical protein